MSAVARLFKQSVEEAVIFVTNTTAGLESSDEEEGEDETNDEDEEKENKEQVDENIVQEKTKDVASKDEKDVVDSLQKLKVEDTKTESS